MKTLSITMVFVLAAACGSESSSGPDGGSVDSGLDPDGPVFLSFNTNTNRLTEGESVRFSAVLTDPDGIDDLIGGVLKSDDGTISYGSFATTGQEGAYGLEVTWGQFHQAQDLTFTTEQDRTVIAEFFDAAGHTVTRSATIAFYCSDDLACAGRCRSGQDDEANCGSCSNSCEAASGCASGVCMQPTGTSQRISCSDWCTLQNSICAPVCGRGDGRITPHTSSNMPGSEAASWEYSGPGGGGTVYSSDCSAVPPAIDGGGANFAFAECCCTE